jgi:hypothetical protein
MEKKVIVMHRARVIGVGVGIDGKIKPDVVLC